MQVTSTRLPWIAVAIAAGVSWTAIGQAGSHSPARASATTIARPTSAQSPYAFQTGVARRHAGRSVVVHYVSRGPDAPRKSDRNRNGVPDYVEVVASEADSALGFYAKPLRCTNTQCIDIGMPPFRAPRRDSAGPDGRPDIYLKAGLAGNGLTVSPRRGEGGGFVLLAPKLELRRQAPRDGVYMILAHELFHLVEFAYVPKGAPAWISEGVANGMARRAWTASNLRVGVRPSTDLAAGDQYDVWLDRPWLSIFSDELDCPRCYGTINWWTEVAAEGDVLQRAFELMARTPSARIGLGIQALDQAIRERGPILGGQTLVDAMGAFWVKLFRFAQPRPLRPLQVAAAERVVGQSGPGRSNPPQPGHLAGLSAHFVPLKVSRNARGVRVTLETDNAREPRFLLFVGPGRFSEQDGRIGREVLPFSPVPKPFNGRPGKAIVVEARFLHPLERTDVLLVIASRRITSTPYRLRYAELSPPANQLCGLTEQTESFCLELASDFTSVRNVVTSVVVDCSPPERFSIGIARPDVIPLAPNHSFASNMFIQEGQAFGAMELRGQLDIALGASGTIRLLGWTVEWEGRRYACSSPVVRWSARRP